MSQKSSIAQSPQSVPLSLTADNKADVLDIDCQNVDVGGVASLDNVLKIDGGVGDGDTLALAAADGWGTADTGTLTGYAIYATGNVRIAVDNDIGVNLA